MMNLVSWTLSSFEMKGGRGVDVKGICELTNGNRCCKC